MYLGTRWGWGSAPRPGPLAPGKDPVHIVQEAVWASEPVWIGAENLAPTGNNAVPILLKCDTVSFQEKGLFFYAVVKTLKLVRG